MYVEFDIPEITEYKAGFPEYWLKSLFIRSPSDRYQINALTSTYIRLVEAALIEYQSGSLRLSEYWSTHSSINLGAMHRSMSHFEACISNMHRAINCFRRLRRDRSQDPLSLHLSSDRAGFAAEMVAERLRKMRNEVHHLEEMVLDGRIANGKPFALGPNGPEVPHPTEANQIIKTIDRIVIGNNEIKFNEIAAWLNEMAAFAAKITDYLPNSSGEDNEETSA